MTTPPLSVCSSTTSLVPTTVLPLAIPEEIPEHPEAPADRAPSTEATESENIDNASDSDDSLFIIEMNSVPVCSTDLPKGAALEERIRRDWRKRRGVEFPGRTKALEASHKEKDNSDNKTTTRGRTMTKLKLEIDPVPSPIQDHERLSPISSPKRRLMSLSPLKTLFPPKSPVHHDRATMSAHPSPSPSPYAASRSTFFRSSSSLATASFLGLPLLSSISVATSKSEPLSRKIFSNKGKERAKRVDSEHLDVWEVLSEDTYAGVDKNGDEHPHSLMSAVESLQSTSNLGASPTRSQSFTFGTHVANTMRAKQSHIHSPETTRDEYSSHVRPAASLRDWKGPSKALLDRPLSRRAPTSLSTLSNASITSSISSLLETPIAEMAPPLPGPPLTSVRIRAPSPSPPPSLGLKHTAHIVQPSPLRVDTIARLNITTDKSAAAIAMHQKALETPLPTTPVHNTRGGSLTTPPARTVPPDLLTDSISEPLTPQITPVPHLSISVLPPSTTSPAKSSSLEPMTPTRRHYSGRPLPRVPPSASNRAGVVDSTYAPNETPLHDDEKSDQSFNSCPEGLLIDLEDTTLDSFSVSGTSTPRSDECRSAPPPHVSTMSRAPSSVELLGDPSLSFESMQATSTPLLPASSSSSQAMQGAGLSDLTDFDLLVSQLADGEQDGSDYDVSYGHNRWRQPGIYLNNKQSDPAVGSGGTWAREPYLTPRASLRHGVLPEVVQPQRQYVAHRAY